MKTLVQKFILRAAHILRDLKDIKYEATHKPDEEVENETPHQAKIRKFQPHKHLIQALGSASAFMMFLFLIFVGGVVILRFAALTDFGRTKIEENLDGLKMGKIGTLQVKGFEGDLFTNFSVREMAIIDEKGAWLEGKNLNVDWTPFDLFRSLIHVSKAKADRIILYRTPQIDQSDKDLHFALEVEELESIVETKEELSIKRGEWALKGDFKVHHNHDFRAKGGIVSVNRPKDNAFVDIDARKKHPLKVLVRAQEADGGALAGLLGLDANQSLFIDADIDGSVEKGNAKINALNGANEIIKLDGNWHEKIGDINGRANLAVSKFTKSLGDILGNEIKITANWNTKTGEGGHSFQDFSALLNGDNSAISIKGPIDIKARKFVSPLNVKANFDGLFGNNAPKITAPSISGTLSGGFDAFDFNGNLDIKNIVIDPTYSLAIRGAIDLAHNSKTNNLKLAIDGFGDNNRMPLSQIFGETPKLRSEIILDNGINIKNIDLIAKKGNLHGIGSKSLLGGFEVKGKAFVEAGAIFDNHVRGPMNGNFTLKQKQKLGFELLVDSKSNLTTNFQMLNDLFTKVTDLKMTILLGRDGVKLPSFEINAGQTHVKGVGANIPNPFSKLIANAQLGEKSSDILGLDGTANGAIEFTGLGEPAKNQFALALKFALNFKNFATPITDLNNIIGTVPSASGVFFFEPDKILLGNGVVKGAKGNGVVNGQLLGANGYALQGNWQTNSVFKIAGLEIQGNPSGQAYLRGMYDNPILEISTIFNKLQLGASEFSNTSINAKTALLKPQFPTQFQVQGNSQYGAIDGTALLLAVKNGALLQDIDLKGAGLYANGSAQFFDNSNPVLNLNFGLAKGVLLENGKLGGSISVRASKENNYAIVAAIGKDVKFRNFDWEFANIDIKGEGRFDGLELKTSITGGAKTPFKFDGLSKFSSTDKNFGLLFDGRGKFYGRDFNTKEPIGLSFTNEGMRGKGEIGFSASQKEQSGFLGFDFANNNNKINAKARFDNVNIALLDNDFAGLISGQLIANGENNKIQGEFNGNISKARPKGEKEEAGLSGKLNAAIANDILKIKTQAETGQGLDVNLNGEFKALTQITPMKIAIDTQGPIKGAIKINGEIRPLFNLAFAGERSLSGKMDLESDFSGTLKSPLFDGAFSIENGSFDEPSLGLALHGLNMVGELAGKQIKIPDFAAKDNKNGEIRGKGTFQLGDENASIFNIHAKKFRLMETDNIKIDASGSVNIDSLNSKSPLMSGALDIDFAEFKPRAFEGVKVPNLDVVEINAPKKSVINKTPNLSQVFKSSQKSIFSNMALDVKLNAPNGGVFVRGRGLNLELSLDANVKGNLGNPNLSGIAKVHKGEYEYGGRTFDFLESGQVYLSTKPENIRLNLTAERDTQNLLARIIVRGTAAEPEIELTSNPDLPKDEILAQVLFGRARSQLSPLETVQLATSLAALASGGGFDVMANLRDIVRLDRLVFANTASGQVSVAGGKYIGRNFYIELISEGSEGISTNVEWRPKNSTAIVSKVKQGGDSKISIRWRRDFK